MVKALLASLGVDNEQTPPFGSTVIFELHGESDKSNSTEPNSTGSNRVRMFYLNETETGNVHHLQIPGCQDPCTVDKFASLVTPLSLSRDEYDAKCNQNEEPQPLSSSSLLLSTSLALLFFLAFVSSANELACWIVNANQRNLNKKLL